jgi:hypothetical protein
MRRLMPRPRPATLALLGVAALLGACGGSEPAPVLDRDATLHLALDEYRIVPAPVEIKADAFPVHIHIVVRNTGKLTHNLKIEAISKGAEQGTNVQPTIYGGTDKTAQPGETVSGDVTLWPGRYRMTCTIANHDNLGQYGTLIVKRSRKD